MQKSRMSFDGSWHRKLAFAGFAVCAGLIAIALYLQYVKGLDPCPLCMIQRIVFIGIGIVFLIAALVGPKGVFVKVYGAIAAVFGIVGVVFAARHVWLQWNPPDFNSCTADLWTQFQRLPFGSVIMRAIAATGDCAKVDWTLLGLSIAQWSFIWFCILTIGALVYAFKRPRIRSAWA
jgi:protein dithiol:quinone oxidoreductase